MDKSETTETAPEPGPAFAPLADLRAALTFLTRLPVGGPHRDISRMAWAFPVAGAVVGVLAALVWSGAVAAGLGPWPAAFLALIASALATGALHEDGLADAADGLGAGGDAERMIAIMRDSRIGGYGALALMLTTGLKAAALASFGTVSAGAAALIAAHTLSRAMLPALMAALPPATTGGLAATAGRPSGKLALAAVLTGCLLGGGAIVAMTGAWLAVPLTVLAVLAAALLLGLYVRRRLGGYTGDTIGLVEQAVEIAVLLVLAALLVQDGGV